MGQRWTDGGYSSDVEIYLILEDRKLPVSLVEGDVIILRDILLRDEEPVPNGHAQLSISVDGETEIHDILIHSFCPDTAELSYA